MIEKAMARRKGMEGQTTDKMKTLIITILCSASIAHSERQQ